MANAVAPDPRPFLDTPQMAARLGIKTQTAQVWRVKGNGPPFIKLGRKVVYDPVELDQWIESNRRTSTSDTGENAHAA